MFSPSGFGRDKKAAPIWVHDFPRVSILKPLKNLVDDLAENLESYFSLDYPNYEIIFGVDSHG